jgi:hypothetical protein
MDVKTLLIACMETVHGSPFIVLVLGVLFLYLLADAFWGDMF